MCSRNSGKKSKQNTLQLETNGMGEFIIPHRINCHMEGSPKRGTLDRMFSFSH